MLESKCHEGSCRIFVRQYFDTEVRVPVTGKRHPGHWCQYRQGHKVDRLREVCRDLNIVLVRRGIAENVQVLFLQHKPGLRQT